MTMAFPSVQVDSIIEKASIRTGDRATVQFSFIKNACVPSPSPTFVPRSGEDAGLAENLVRGALLPTRISYPVSTLCLGTGSSFVKAGPERSAS